MRSVVLESDTSRNHHGSIRIICIDDRFSWRRRDAATCRNGIPRHERECDPAHDGVAGAINDDDDDDDDSQGEALNARFSAAVTTAPLPTRAAFRRGPHQERIEAQLAAQSNQLAAQTAQMAILVETMMHFTEELMELKNKEKAPATQGTPAPAGQRATAGQ